MRDVLCVVLGLLGIACQPPPSLLVTVDSIPSGSQSLAVIAVVDGHSTLSELSPYALAQPAPSVGTFLLTLKPDSQPSLNISVAAFDQPGGQGCLLAAGGAGSVPFQGPDDALRISLVATDDPAACSGRLPLLLGASPQLGTSRGGETIELSGWGFQSDSTVTMGGKDSSVTFVSSTRLQITTPVQAGFGPTAIRVTNQDGGFDSRADLFRFYSEMPAFDAATIDNSLATNAMSNMAIGVFDPTASVDLVVTLPGAPGTVRVEFIDQGVVNRRDDYAVGKNPGPLAIADFNKDGHPDIAVANIDDGTLQLLTDDGSGCGKFVAGSPQKTSAGANPLPSALAAIDLNGDGASELILTNRQTTFDEVRSFLNDGTGGLTLSKMTVPVAYTPVDLAVGDLNQDSYPDIAVISAGQWPLGDYRLYLLINLGNGQFDTTATTKMNLTSQPTSVAIKDIDGNGIPDLVVSFANANQLTVFRNLGNTNLMTYDLMTDPQPGKIAIADVNGDGADDLIVPCAGSDSVNIFLNKQGTGFEGVQAVKQPAGCSMPHQVTATDLDTDGKTDLIILGSGCIGALLNQSK